MINYCANFEHFEHVKNFFNVNFICANPPLFNLEKMKSIFFITKDLQGILL